MYTTYGSLTIKFEDGADGKRWLNTKCGKMTEIRLRGLFNEIGTTEIKQGVKEWNAEFELDVDSPLDSEELYKYLRQRGKPLSDSTIESLFKDCDGNPRAEVSHKVTGGELFITIWVRASKTKGPSKHGSLDMMAARGKNSRIAAKARKEAKAEREAAAALADDSYVNAIQVIMSFNAKKIKDGKAVANGCSGLDKAMTAIIKELKLGRPKWVGKHWWIAEAEYAQNDGAMDNAELAKYLINHHKPLNPKVFDDIVKACPDLQSVEVQAIDNYGKAAVKIVFGG